MTREEGTYKVQSERAAKAQAHNEGTYKAQADRAAGKPAQEAKPGRQRTKMVAPPNDYLVPERDALLTPVLECRHLGIDFGGLKAVEDLNLMVGKTEIAGLIGPNGAGKTTVFNLLTKVYQPTRGTILLDGVDTAGMDTARVSREGIARTFQNIRLFDSLTVEDNVKIGLHNQVACGMWSGIFRASSTSALSSCSTCSTWPTTPMTSRVRCPMAPSVGSRSSARWPPIPSCSCSTSLPPA